MSKKGKDFRLSPSFVEMDNTHLKYYVLLHTPNRWMSLPYGQTIHCPPGRVPYQTLQPTATVGGSCFCFIPLSKALPCFASSVDEPALRADYPLPPGQGSSPYFATYCRLKADFFCHICFHSYHRSVDEPALWADYPLPPGQGSSPNFATYSHRWWLLLLFYTALQGFALLSGIKQKQPTVCRLLKFGGKRWIRTTEVTDNRFTVCSLWPLGNLPILWSW